MKLDVLSFSTSTLRSSLPGPLLSFIEKVAPGRTSTQLSVLEQHGRDESGRPAVAPDLVVYPHSTEEISQIVAACNEAGTAVVPYGIGTSLEGHVAALRGGVSLDMVQMNHILEVNHEDMDCRVQAGVTHRQLNQALRSHGAFFPVDPGADATIGGMASTRASGTNAVRYGTMRDAVMGLTVVLADGRVMRTGGRSRKSSAGFDLTRLMVGSEGTLGVVTEVALRLHGVPEAITTAVCEFKAMKGAVDAVTEIIQCAIPIARMELLDEVAINAVNAYSKTTLTAAPTVFFEFHGTDLGVEEQAKLVGEIVEEHSGTGFQWAATEAERARLWSARHSAYWACVQLRPGAKIVTTDVCVPVSKLADCILGSQREARDAGILAPLVGHVGDGNFHMMLLIDPNSSDEVMKAQAMVDNMVHRAHSLGGTCTGEHGIGQGKLKYLEAEHGRVPLDVMHALKAALDPNNILNPGKLGSDPDSFAPSAPQ
ncbi:unnamed protein product [Ostreobium quekettii]|uniref:D-lactate dehydrogenase (cytochrome) n=1 Tax=Ostreobium quekettii TaxID=121088 RepID=A0A8S1J4L7_9CHLO|nr:unnamed protein product [Ostreobium quekettii]